MLLDYFDLKQHKIISAVLINQEVNPDYLVGHKY